VSHHITLIGGGSSTFTPALMKLFAGSQVLSGSAITLMDIDERRLDVMTRLCRLLVKQTGAKLDIKSTTDRRAALTGADFVITSIAAGGFDAWEHDIEIPAKYGIFMTTADTIGPGGIMRAFRHIPALVEVCRDLAEVAPDAWVFNYTNPASANVFAMRKAGAQRIVSLCSGTVLPRRGGWGMGGFGPDEVMLPAPAAGINHCTAVVELKFKDGRDAFPAVLERLDYPVTKWILETYGILPYPASHWVEFYPALCRLEEPYTGRAQGLKMKYGTIHVMDEERERAAKWERLVQQWAKGEGEGTSLDALPASEGIEVVDIIESLIENRSEVFAVNVPNRGAIPNLPDDAIVEISSVVNAYGVHPLQMPALPEPIAAHMRQHIAVEQLTAEAALSGSRKLALEAFLEDLHVQRHLLPAEAEKLMDEMLAAHKKWVPAFG
jgi:alpha-galactosidase